MTLRLETGNREAFFRAPFHAYGADSAYVSPLKSDLIRFVDPDRNPLFTTGSSAITIFTAHRNGRPIGRITAHDHAASNAHYALKRAYFGYFDCADDTEAATTLLNAAEAWARDRGHTEIMGNFNLTAMQQIGVVTGGHDIPPYTDLMWNPPHIPRLLQAHGYTAEFPMTTFEVSLDSAEAPRIGPKQQAILDDPDFAFAPITRWNVRMRMEQARGLLNAAFAQNPMFVPVSAEEFHFQAKDMAWIIDPRISALLMHRGAPAATILCVPDMNPFLRRIGSRAGPATPWHFVRHKLSCRRAVLIFSAVRPDLQGRGVNPIVLRRVILALKAAGYRTLGNTWIADVNPASLAQKKKSGARKLHRLHLFRKALA
ncbi:MAG: GNAT family N-acetyltransferase [Pseudomonadota bacterium]